MNRSPRLCGNLWPYSGRWQLNILPLFLKQQKLQKPAVAISGTRQISKRNQKLNDALPQIEVAPETYQVRANGNY